MNTSNNNHLDAPLKTCAFNYIAKYQTTSYKLKAVLIRKITKLACDLDEATLNTKVEEIIQYMINNNYIDDTQYIKNKIIYLINRGKPLPYIRSNLYQNIQDYNIIKEILSQFDLAKLEIVSLIKFLQKKKMAQWQKEEQREKYNDNYLLNKGFGHDTIQYVLNLTKEELIEYEQQSDLEANVNARK